MKQIKILLVIIIILTAYVRQIFAFTIEDEIAVGKEASAKLEKEYSVLTDDKYQGRINYIGGQLYKVCPKPELPYAFKVIDTDVFNAMAFPGGFIYATRELMNKCNDGEIAFILGHEMAHCAHSHQFKQAEKDAGSSLGLLALALILTQGNLSSGAMNTVSLAHAVMNSSYSRADEQQADIDSLSYMAGAGYDPGYAISAFEKMKSYGGAMPDFLNTIVGSHPLPDERIKYAKNRISEMNFQPKPSNPFPAYGKDITGYGYNDRAENKKTDTEQKNIPKDEKDAPKPQSSSQQALSKMDEVLKQEADAKKKGEKPFDADNFYKTYRAIPFGALTKEELAKAPSVPEVENIFYQYLKKECYLHGELARDRKLDNKARFLALRKTQRNITPKYIIYADIIPADLGYYDYEESFYKYDLGKIQLLNKTFNKIGLTFKLLPDNRKYVIIVFEYK